MNINERWRALANSTRDMWCGIPGTLLPDGRFKPVGNIISIDPEDPKYHRMEREQLEIMIVAENEAYFVSCQKLRKFDPELDEVTVFDTRASFQSPLIPVAGEPSVWTPVGSLGLGLQDGREWNSTQRIN